MVLYTRSKELATDRKEVNKMKDENGKNSIKERLIDILIEFLIGLFFYLLSKWFD